MLVAHPRTGGRAHKGSVGPETSISLGFPRERSSRAKELASSPGFRLNTRRLPSRDRAVPAWSKPVTLCSRAPSASTKGRWEKARIAKTLAWSQSSSTGGTDSKPVRRRPTRELRHKARRGRSSLEPSSAAGPSEPREAGGGRRAAPTKGTRRPLQAAGGNTPVASSSLALPASSSGYIFFPPPRSQSVSLRLPFFPSTSRRVSVFSGKLPIKFFSFSLPGAPPQV